MRYIGKSYLQLTKEEKDYFIDLYYKNKNITVNEIGTKLGLIYSDGFVGDEKFNNLSITQNNKELLEQVKRELNYTGDIRKGNKGSFENLKEGYFDGDGSISKYVHTFIKGGKFYSYDKGKMCIIATKNMLKDIIDTFNIERYHISNSKTEQMKYIQIESKSELFKIYNLMYKECNICNKSKKEKWENLMSAIM